MIVRWGRNVFSAARHTTVQGVVAWPYVTNIAPGNVTQVGVEEMQGPSVFAYVTQIAVEEIQGPSVIANVTQVGVEPMQGPSVFVNVTQIGVEVMQPNIGDSTVTQLKTEACALRPFYQPPCESCVGGGGVPAGTTPIDGVSLLGATTPFRAWIELQVDGGDATIYLAKEAINAATRKTPSVQSFGVVSRSLSGFGQGLETTRVTSTLDDWDGQLMAYYLSGVVLNQVARYYVASLATIEAAGAPWHVLTGVVRKFTPLGDGTFTLTVEDALTQSKGLLSQSRLIPAELLGTRPITDGNPRDFINDKPVPHAYGSLSDEDEFAGFPPDGMASTIYINQSSQFVPTLPPKMDIFLVSGGCVSDILCVYAADYLNTPPGEEPVERAELPEIFWGSEGWHPFHPTWPFSDKWVQIPSDEPERRYTPILVRSDHVVAKMAREGRVPMTANVCGQEAVGDATGLMIDNPAYLAQHIVNTRALTESMADWPPVASFDGYGLIDTASVAAVAGQCDALGLVAAGVLGHHDQQKTLGEVLTDLSMSFGYEFGITRHGLLLMDMLNVSSGSYVREYNDVSHVPVDGLRFGQLPVFTEVAYAFRRLYTTRIPGLSPSLIQEQQVRLPVDPTTATWASGLRTLPNETAIAAMGGRPLGLLSSPVVAMEWVQNEVPAETVAGRLLDVYSGPAPRLEMAFPVRFRDGGLQDELGSIIRLSHRKLPSTPRRLQVRRIDADLDTFYATLTGRDVEDLLP